MIFSLDIKREHVINNKVNYQKMFIATINIFCFYTDIKFRNGSIHKYYQIMLTDKLSIDICN